MIFCPRFLHFHPFPRPHVGQVKETVLPAVKCWYIHYHWKVVPSNFKPWQKFWQKFCVAKYVFLHRSIPVSIRKPEKFPVSMVAIPLHSWVQSALLVEKVIIFWAVKGNQMTLPISKLRAHLHRLLKWQVPDKHFVLSVGCQEKGCIGFYGPKSQKPFQIFLSICFFWNGLIQRQNQWKGLGPKILTQSLVGAWHLSLLCKLILW